VHSNLRSATPPGTVLKLNHAIHVDRDPDWVFRELHDPKKMLSCVPGASLTRALDADTFAARVALGIGPMKLAYTGSARVTRIDRRARSAAVDIEGSGETGAGRAKASIAVRPTDTSCVVYVSVLLTLEQSPTWLGSDLVYRVASTLLRRSCESLKQQLEAA
jgi:carbon monoxide dehydrogenase subunit G